VGVTEGRRSSFEQSNPRAPSIPKKYMTKMVDNTPRTVTLEPVTKKKNVSKIKEGGGKSRGRGRTKLNMRKPNLEGVC
jgi:hypothetical protein